MPTKRNDAVAAVAVLLSPPSSGYCDNNGYDNDTCTDTTRTSLRLLTTPSCGTKIEAELIIIENTTTTQILLLLPKLDTIRIIKFVIYGS